MVHKSKQQAFIPGLYGLLFIPRLLRIAAPLIAILMAFAIQAGVEAQTPTQALSCEEPDAFKAAKLFDEAITGYTALLDKQSSLECATNGINEIALVRAEAQRLYGEGKVYESAKQPGRAKAAYIAGLSLDPHMADAKTALSRVLASASDDGASDAKSVDAMINAGALTAAKEKLKETLGTSQLELSDQLLDDLYFRPVRVQAQAGAYTEARESLKKVLGETGLPAPEDLKYLLDRFALVRAQANAGLHDEAKTELKKVITETGQTVPEDLTYLVEDKRGFRNSLRKNLGDQADAFQQGAEELARELGAIALGLGILFLPVLAFTLLYIWARRFWRSQMVLNLEIQDFGDGPAGDGMGKSVSTMVEEALQHLGGKRAALLTGTLDPAGLPDVGTATSQLKWVTNLMQWLLPPWTLALAGDLHWSTTKGAGLTVCLSDTQKKTVIDNITIWETEFGPPVPSKDPKAAAPYYGLAESAAIWTAYTIRGMDTANLFQRIGRRLLAIARSLPARPARAR